MFTKYGIVFCEGKKINNKYQKEICTHSSKYNPFIVTNFIDEVGKTIILCVLTVKFTDYWIVECVDHPQVENQSICTEVNSYLCLKYFLIK